MSPARTLIVNADDFGLSTEVNRGIMAAYEGGIVTSATLMVRGAAAVQAAEYGGANQGLSMGLHLDLEEWEHVDEEWRRRYQVVDPADGAAVVREVERQLAAFQALTGRDPTHLDSHQHAHRGEPARGVLARVGARLGVPVREVTAAIAYRGDFYGQSGKGHPLPHAITVDALEAIIRALPAGVTELGCHPGLGRIDSVYDTERTIEVRTLRDPRLPVALAEHDVRLASFAEVNRDGEPRPTVPQPRDRLGSSVGKRMVDVQAPDHESAVALDRLDGPYCPTCRTDVDEFQEHNRRLRARCPKCGSLERHRFLSYLIDRLAPMVAGASAVLDIAPQGGVREQLQALAGDRYVGFDIKMVRKVDACGDLHHLPFPDGVFDVIVCYHVLEHVPDDHTAFRELARVLSPRGVMLFQVPYRSVKLTDEDPDASPEERTRRFGQHDHIRFYGTDLVDRMAAGGLEASQLRPATLLDAGDLQRFAITPERVWLCRRPDPWSHRRPGVLEDGALLVTATATARAAGSSSVPDPCVAAAEQLTGQPAATPTEAAAKSVVPDGTAAVSTASIESADGIGFRVVFDVRVERVTG